MAKQLLTEAGFPDGQGLPQLTLYTRNAFPALTNAAEAIAAMLKENLGMNVQIQNLDYDTFMDKLRSQKRSGAGDFSFAMVPYEFDFVDGSNMLSVWGGCEPKASPTGARCRAATHGTVGIQQAAVRRRPSPQRRSQAQRALCAGREDPGLDSGPGADLPSDQQCAGQALSQGDHVRSQRFRLEDLDALPLRAPRVDSSNS